MCQPRRGYAPVCPKFDRLKLSRTEKETKYEREDVVWKKLQYTLEDTLRKFLFPGNRFLKNQMQRGKIGKRP